MTAPRAFTQEQYELIKATTKYDPETGTFQRLDGRTSEWRELNLKPSSNGYLQIGYYFGNRQTMVLGHRVAYLLMTGELDFPTLDHINGDRLDTRWTNLRTATIAQNHGNMRRLGVDYHKHTKKWRARMKINNRTKHLGLYETKEEAIEAYRKAHAERHKEFSPYYQELLAA